MLYGNFDVKRVDYAPDKCEDMMIVTIEFYSNKKEEILIFPLDMWRDNDTMVKRKVGQYIKENLDV